MSFLMLVEPFHEIIKKYDKVRFKVHKLKTVILVIALLMNDSDYINIV